MDRKRKLEVAKGKGKLAMPPTRKSPRLAGLPPILPPTSPKYVLRPNKLLVLAIAAARREPNPKAQASAQATVVEPPKDTKGKKTARISMKPLRKRFSQRIIARGGPSRPKPNKVEDRDSMMILTTGTMVRILISGALMWPEASQLRLSNGILQRRRKTALPRPPPQTRDGTLLPHSTKVVQFSEEGGKLQLSAV
ncbi:hypothetical protein PIB30_031122 [Stylosanthes scabra]|uniref:Uncharacterized protein n=1 Tax=Stylosanthes scabra TaxID=79078 RepID=A0ABU6W9T4_9FABA|nr:hypothetical protein [Stylosanthes scabra]